jgi:protein disulfide-isomerase
MQKSAVFISFAIGAISGLAIYQIVLSWGGWTLVGPEALQQQASHLSQLEEENRQLTEELFRPRLLQSKDFEGLSPPYDGDDDASVEVAAARAAALEEQKFLMVTFGANWCQDCWSLHRNLHDGEVMAYTEDLFRFVNVDVGKFNQNRHVADELGVSLSRGIPVAIFFDAQGRVIGTTNDGQLEPARHYTSKQILKFVRDIAERHRILRPDAVQ